VIVRLLNQTPVHEPHVRTKAIKLRVKLQEEVKEVHGRRNLEKVLCELSQTVPVFDSTETLLEHGTHLLKREL